MSDLENMREGYWWALFRGDTHWSIVEVDAGDAYLPGIRRPVSAHLEIDEWGPYLGDGEQDPRDTDAQSVTREENE